MVQYRFAVHACIVVIQDHLPREAQYVKSTSFWPPLLRWKHWIRRINQNQSKLVSTIVWFYRNIDLRIVPALHLSLALLTKLTLWTYIFAPALVSLWYRHTVLSPGVLHLPPDTQLLLDRIGHSPSRSKGFAVCKRTPYAIPTDVFSLKRLQFPQDELYPPRVYPWSSGKRWSAVSQEVLLGLEI